MFAKIKDDMQRVEQIRRGLRLMEKLLVAYEAKTDYEVRIQPGSSPQDDLILVEEFSKFLRKNIQLKKTVTS